MADLYVYFYELGLSLLKPGGRLSFVVTNKWMKAGYGEPLRRFFAEKGWVESVVDFGHAKQIFEDADVFPSIIVVRRPDDGTVPDTTRVCAIPREQLRVDDLSVQIAKEGVEVERRRLRAGAWSLEPESVNDFSTRSEPRDSPLRVCRRQAVDGHQDRPQRRLPDRAPPREARSSEIGPGVRKNVIRPYLRGQDIGRWLPEWAGLWMIALKSSGDHPWPWANRRRRGGGELSGDLSGPSSRISSHSKRALRKGQDQGHHWWELRACRVLGRTFEKPQDRLSGHHMDRRTSA